MTCNVTAFTYPNRMHHFMHKYSHPSRPILFRRESFFFFDGVFFWLNGREDIASGRFSRDLQLQEHLASTGHSLHVMIISTERNTQPSSSKSLPTKSMCETKVEHLLHEICSAYEPEVRDEAWSRRLCAIDRLPFIQD